uniref:Uncharacterized protein n=1 Tax=viral metagenome TaxID=1070528 RepID=A0A6C0ASH8_9ZZZZ
MNTSDELSIKICWYGARETMITHITNLSELSEQLGLTKIEIKNYLLNRIITSSIYIEGNTLKIAGFITEPILKILFNEYKRSLK